MRDIELISHYLIFFFQLVWYFIYLHNGKIRNLIPVIKNVKEIYSQTITSILLDKL